jgi:hypothetical protein
MAKQTKKILSPEIYERHERVQRMLLDRIEFHEKRAAERSAEQQKPERN